MPKEALSAKLVTKRWVDAINSHWDARLIKMVEDIECIKVKAMYDQDVDEEYKEIAP